MVLTSFDSSHTDSRALIIPELSPLSTGTGEDLHMCIPYLFSTFYNYAFF
jgi:hypothetical protein